MTDKAPRFAQGELEVVAHGAPPSIPPADHELEACLARALLAEREARRLDVEALRACVSTWTARPPTRYAASAKQARARIDAWEKEGRE